MTFRNINVVLSATVSGYKAQFGSAAAATEDFARRSRQAMQTAAKDAQKFGSAIANAKGETAQGIQELSRMSLLISGGLAVGIGLAVKRFAEFDAVMSQVGAASNATGNELLRLRQAALQAGQDTVFSATQAAQGMLELAKAGVSNQDILQGGLIGALNLAAAGQISVAQAAETAASAMTVFGLRGQDVSHIADTLAAGANKAQGGVHDMGMALQQSSLVANQFGLTIDDTVGSLALFARNGLIGSDAGTSFKTMLQRLVPQSDQAASLMKKLNIEFFDAQGNFIGIEKAAGELQEGLKDLTQEQRVSALYTIFGQDAIRGATILYKEGAKGVAEWRNNVNDSGAAARLAAAQMDNLKGDLEKLRGSLETALIKTGQQADGSLRGLTQAATGAVNAFSSLPSSVQATAIGFTALVSAGTGLVGITGTLLPKFREVKTSLDSIQIGSVNAGTAFSRTAQAAGILGAALAVGGTIYALWAAQQERARQSAQALTDILQLQADTVQRDTDEWVINELGKRKALDTIQRYKLDQRDVNDAIFGNAEAQERVTQALIESNPRIHESVRLQELLRAAMGGSKEAAKEFVNAADNTPDERKLAAFVRHFAEVETAYDRGTNAAKQNKTAQDDAANGSSAAAKALGELGISASGAASSTDELTDAQKALSKAFDSFATPESAFRTAQQNAQEAARAAVNSAKLSERSSTESQRRQTAAQRDAIEQRYQAERHDLQRTKESIVQRSASSKSAVNEEIRELDRRKKAELDAFDNTAKLNRDTGDSYSAMADDVKVALNSYIGELDKQNTAMARWQENLTKIAAKTTPAVALELSRLGPTAAPLIQEFADASADQVRRAADQIQRNMSLRGLGAQMAEDWEVTAVRARLGAGQTVTSIATELQIGVERVRAIAEGYQAALVNAARPILIGTGQWADASGDIDREINVRKRADGGFDREAQVAKPGSYILWAESETGGESYIPHAPGKRQRSVSILAQTADLFGLDVVDPRTGGHVRRFAEGGFVTGPYGLPKPPKLPEYLIAQMASATMNKAFEGVLAQIMDGGAGALGAGKVGSGYQALLGLLGGVAHTVTSTTGGRHAKGSYHYQGKAVDLVGPNMMAIFNRLLQSATNLAELFYTPAGFSVKNGKRVAPIAAAGHYDHVHAATYDKGGALMPGWTMAYNGTGKPEHVMTEAQIGRIVGAIEKSKGKVEINVSERSSPRQTAREVARRFG